jgi:23S rRNA (uridine2552-2'-O)-methyltransferase
MARSVFKLEEIDQKYKIFGADTTTVMDIGCAPGSRLQYAQEALMAPRKHKSSTGGKPRKPFLIGFDIKDVTLDLPGMFTYNQDIQDLPAVEVILAQHSITKFDVIISDMAPNTIGFRDIDALRSVELLRKTLPLYKNFLKPDGKAVVKIFMGP